MGLKNHSEIGWVLREYNTLVENALKLGIKSPEIYYHDGKLKGKTSRDKSDEVIASVKEVELGEKVNVSEIKIEPSDIIEEIEVLQSQRKPTLNELPNLVNSPNPPRYPSSLKVFCKR